MKVCVIGLGSIGKRHTKNLIKVLGDRGDTYVVDVLRSNRTALPNEFNEIIQNQYYSVEELPNGYDVIFVTNPTFCHYDTVKNVLGKTRHMFIEKPVFDSLTYELCSLPLRSDGVYYVACPLRHKSIMRYVKEEIMSKESVLSARIISSSYLPMWRRETDYRNTYSAHKDMGGGVTRDLIHEWDYALDLFGDPTRVYHIQRHISKLDIDSDDISIYIAEYPKMFLEVHLDYIGQKTERVLQLFTNGKRIDIDLIQNRIVEYAENKLVSEKHFQEEDCYVNEMEYFIDCIEGKRSNINTVDKAYHTLKIALTER